MFNREFMFNETESLVTISIISTRNPTIWRVWGIQWHPKSPKLLQIFCHFCLIFAALFSNLSYCLLYHAECSSWSWKIPYTAIHSDLFTQENGYHCVFPSLMPLKMKWCSQLKWYLGSPCLPSLSPSDHDLLAAPPVMTATLPSYVLPSLLCPVSACQMSLITFVTGHNKTFHRSFSSSSCLCSLGVPSSELP